MPHRRLLPHLLSTLADHRRQAGGKVRHIAFHADVAETTIYNIERDPAGRTSWPDDTDEIVNAYARALGVAAVDLWREALDRWATALPADSGQAPPMDPIPPLPALGAASPAPREARREPETNGREGPPTPRRRRKSA